VFGRPVSRSVAAFASAGERDRGSGVRGRGSDPAVAGGPFAGPVLGDLDQPVLEEEREVVVEGGAARLVAQGADEVLLVEDLGEGLQEIEEGVEELERLAAPPGLGGRLGAGRRCRGELRQPRDRRRLGASSRGGQISPSSSPRRRATIS